MTQTPPPPRQVVFVPQPARNSWKKGGGLSVAAFVLSLLGATLPLGMIAIILDIISPSSALFILLLYSVPFCSLIAIILGAAALVSNRGKKSKHAKKGLAVAGMIIGGGTFFLLAILLVPVLSHFGDLSEQAVCRFTLKGIGRAVRLYTDGHDGRYPATLEDLIDDDYISRKRLRSPADKIQRPCSYFYCAPEQPKPPAKLEEIDPQTFIACTFDDVYDDFRHVLPVDGVVRKFSDAEFRAELAKPCNAKFAAALKQTEGP